MDQQEQDRLEPVAQRERVLAIDMLRGVAVLGILLLNIQAFAMPSSAYMNPTSFGDLSGWNYVVWYWTYLLGSAKFMTIFSLLFGAGVLIMSERAEARGRRGTSIHYRRMMWLILFGLLHAHLIWYGDILYFYGMCGLLIWPLRKLPVWLQMTVGMLAIAAGSGLALGFGVLMQHAPPEEVAKFAAGWTPSPEMTEQEIAAYRGSWWDQMPYRTTAAVKFETIVFLMFGIWRAGGLMLVGMALYRMGVMKAARSARFYAVMAPLGFGMGVPLVAYEVHLTESKGWSMDAMFIHSQINYWASMLIAGGWIALVMLWAKAGARGPVARAFAAVGQMALTNYLLQSVICTLIFYGHGLGYFGSLERWEQFLVVAGVWVFELILSPIWLSRFRFGPFEWLWRSLTYWRLQPMMREAPGEGLESATL